MARVSPHTKKYNRVIDIVCADLGIERPIVKWIQRKKSNGRAYGDEWIEVNPNRDTRSVIRTIMHELRHVWQYVHGYLKSAPARTVKTNRGTYRYIEQQFWKGIAYDKYNTKVSESKYKSMPWEKDAYAYMDEIGRLFPGKLSQYLNEKPITINNSLIVHFSSGKVNYLRTVKNILQSGGDVYSYGLDRNKVKIAVNNVKAKGLL